MFCPGLALCFPLCLCYCYMVTSIASVVARVLPTHCRYHLKIARYLHFPLFSLSQLSYFSAFKALMCAIMCECFYKNTAHINATVVIVSVPVLHEIHHMQMYVASYIERWTFLPVPAPRSVRIVPSYSIISFWLLYPLDKCTVDSLHHLNCCLLNFSFLLVFPHYHCYCNICQTHECYRFRVELMIRGSCLHLHVYVMHAFYSQKLLHAWLERAIYTVSQVPTYLAHKIEIISKDLTSILVLVNLYK